MGTIEELLGRVKAATGPDRELDALIHEPSLTPDEAGLADEFGIPAYTASIDAALALTERVLPGWQWCLNRLGTPMALVNNGPGAQFECERATTMPLAILTATLSAQVKP